MHDKIQKFKFAFYLCLTILSILPLKLKPCCADSSSTIITIAGNGVNAHSGDGGLASLASIANPTGLVVDSVGNVYFCETGGAINTVRKISPAGIISTVAGMSSSGGYSGDGGPATSAQLGGPIGLAIDSSNNLYIADYWNNVIRKVDSAGIISTYAGTGAIGHTGDGGLATLATFGGQPFSIAVDTVGNLYIADTANYDIRKVDPSGIITTVAGNETAGFSGDGGLATAAQLGWPETVIADGFGNIYIWDDIPNVVIRKVNSSGIISTFAGTPFVRGCTGDGGPATAATFGDLEGMSFGCSGNLFLSDDFCNNIREINLSNTVLPVAGTGISGFAGDGGPASAAKLQIPFGISVDVAGNIYIADKQNERIRKIVSGCTLSPTLTSTFSPTITATATQTASPSSSASPTCSNSSTTTRTQTLTATPTVTVTGTPLPTLTITLTSTLTLTLTPTPLPLLLHPYAPNPNPAGPQGLFLPYWLQTAARIKIRIFTVSGEKVRDLTPFGATEGGNEQYWDEKNDYGTPVSSGIYVVRIEAESPKGEVVTAFEKCSVLR